MTITGGLRMQPPADRNGELAAENLRLLKLLDTRRDEEQKKIASLERWVKFHKLRAHAADSHADDLLKQLHVTIEERNAARADLDRHALALDQQMDRAEVAERKLHDCAWPDHPGATEWQNMASSAGKNLGRAINAELAVEQLTKKVDELQERNDWQRDKIVQLEHDYRICHNDAMVNAETAGKAQAKLAEARDVLRNSDTPIASLYRILDDES
jgi:predicted  nucleic acid-binding Zn-ribbon protein